MNQRETQALVYHVSNHYNGKYDVDTRSSQEPDEYFVLVYKNDTKQFLVKVAGLGEWEPWERLHGWQVL
jgi:hypothetical protein